MPRMIATATSLLTVGLAITALGVQSADAMTQAQRSGLHTTGWFLQVTNHGPYKLTFVDRYHDGIDQNETRSVRRGGSAEILGMLDWTKTGRQANMSAAYQAADLDVARDWHRFVDIRLDGDEDDTKVIISCGVTKYDGPFDRYKDTHDDIGCEKSPFSFNEPIRVTFTDLPDGEWKALP